MDYNILDEKSFYPIADFLLNNCTLNVNKKKFRIVEIEFYLKSPKHNDEYTHCNPEQLLFCFYYFHKFATGTFKCGTFKGLDLTFGQEKENIYFGVLIRSIMDMENNQVIEGPCNVVNKILSYYDCKKVIEFISPDTNLSIFKNDKKLHIKQENTLNNEEIFSGPRIGLSNKYPQFQNKPYRFCIYQNKIKKNKKTLVKIQQ